MCLDQAFISFRLPETRTLSKKQCNLITLIKKPGQLGHNLGLKVVAEGVEDKETYLALKNMDCDILQGYFISRPAPAKDFMDWAQRQGKDGVLSNNKLSAQTEKVTVPVFPSNCSGSRLNLSLESE